jgi:ribosomal protein S8
LHRLLLGGHLATILEVTKLKLPWTEYRASVQLRCREDGKEAISRVFQISFTGSEDLKRKLIIEKTKFKYTLFLLGVDELKRRGVAL